ncbi:MAG: hypothetical protein ABSC94_23320 [Polyangiaceae bacterium]
MIRDGRPRLRAISAALTVVATLAAGRTTRAQPAEAFARVAVLATDEDASELEAALVDLLGHQALRVRVVPVGLTSAARTLPLDVHECARIWIDMQSEPDIVLWVAAVRDGLLEQPAERRISRGDSHAILLEQTAQVAYDTLESLLASDGAPPPTPGPPETAGPVTAREPTPGRERKGATGVAVSAHAFASWRAIAAQAPAAAGGGAAMDIGLGRGRGHPDLWLSFGFNSPFDVKTAQLTLETNVSCLRVVPSIEVVEHRWLRLDLGLGAGIDLLSTVLRDQRGPPYVAGHLTPTADIVATGQAMLRAPLPSGAGLTLAADIDYDWAPHRYDLVVPPKGAETVFQPWPLRPAVMAGLCVPLAGEGACATR